MKEVNKKFPQSVCIATPAHEGTCKMGYVESLLPLVIELIQRNVGVYFTTSKGALVVAGRNLCVDFFLKQTSATHLFFIDSDMSWRTADVMRMLEYGNLDVVGAMCPRKEYDWERIARIARARPDLPASDLPLYGVKQILEIPVQDDVMEVEAIGTGMMLIRREVFEALKNAHPEWLQGGHSIHSQTFAYFGGARNADGVSEDIAFCADVRSIGGSIHACPWLRIGHIGNHEFVGHPVATHR
ncbi:hypothetical protein [Paraburkholderia humisilvae]|uniref:Glycosyltransferase 2-like domain-containing protein n=1 Tax=Paraburkholderia humisilvae TaxID=627669 RepID=A0A6J5F784_9BURK|nr:hypothetical protein [Paraburkholderia humisilvae]CAB3774659.1 hypothetical protein LMG29542_08037 [Paraburkholderia humisilvae]